MRKRSRFLLRTPSAIRALVSSDRVLPLFHGVFPLLAADILALDADVCEYPPAAVGMGTSMTPGFVVVVVFDVEVDVDVDVVVDVAAVVVVG